MVDILYTIFSICFTERNIGNSIEFLFRWNVFLETSLSYVDNGSGSGFGVVSACRQQAITSTKIDQDLWRHMTSLGLSELIMN